MYNEKRNLILNKEKVVRRKVCPVVVRSDDLVEWLYRGELAIRISLVGSEVQRLLFERKTKSKHLGTPMGGESFTPYRTMIDIYGFLCESGKVVARGWLNNNHDMRCDLIFNLWTGKGKITALF